MGSLFLRHLEGINRDHVLFRSSNPCRGPDKSATNLTEQENHNALRARGITVAFPIHFHLSASIAFPFISLHFDFHFQSGK